MRRKKPREETREQLEARWELNSKRSEEGWPQTPLDLEDSDANSARLTTFDALGRPRKMTVRGKGVWIAPREIVRYSMELEKKVGRWKSKKEISGQDVMEILGIAFEVTNDPAYAAARRAMKRHRLHTGGLKRAFVDLHRRHHEPRELACLRRIPWYLENRYNLREAVEHVVANEGIPGPSFSTVVDRVRHAYARREKLNAERLRYLNELRGADRIHGPQPEQAGTSRQPAEARTISRLKMLVKIVRTLFVMPLLGLGCRCLQPPQGLADETTVVPSKSG
jgi:hypothetical protein